MIEADKNSNPKSGLFRQIVCSIIVSLMSLYSGMGQGWLSPMSLKLKSDDSPVDKMNKEELSFLVTYPLYAAFFIAPLLSYLGKRYGRKTTFLVCSVPNILSGVILVFAPSKLWLYVGRVVGSFRMSGIAIAEMYVSEITHESIRGMFMSFCTVQINIGILVAYALGKSLNYVAFNTLYVIVPFMCFLLVLYIPESPHFLMERQRKDDAMKSMLWLKNGDQTVAELELQAIERAGNNQNEKASVKQIWNDKASRSAMLIGVLSFSFQTLSGIHPVLNYAGIIFEESSSFLSPDDSSIVTAVILLVASIVNVMLIEGFGRKPLLYVSLIGSTICLSVLSVFLFALSNGVDVGNLGFVPVASISSFVFMYGIGLAAVPNALTNEVSPTNIRPAMGGAASITSTLILIAVLQSFPFLDEKIGLYFVFVIPVFTNIAGVFFTWFVVPETKGKTLAEISEELRDR